MDSVEMDSKHTPLLHRHRNGPKITFNVTFAIRWPGSPVLAIFHIEDVPTYYSHYSHTAAPTFEPEACTICSVLRGMVLLANEKKLDSVPNCVERGRAVGS
jgi:hypothetical protein